MPALPLNAMQILNATTFIALDAHGETSEWVMAADYSAAAVFHVDLAAQTTFKV